MRLGRDLDKKSFGDDARKCLEKAKEIYLARLGKDHPFVGSVNYLLGRSYHFANHYSKALELSLDSVRVYETMGAEGLAPAKLAHQQIVKTYYALEKPEEATRHCIAIGAINEKLGMKELELIIPMDTDHPRYALENRLSAYVTVEYRISAEGYPQESKVVESGGSVFDKNALSTVARGRFAPRFVDGKPVAVEGQKIRIHMGHDAAVQLFKDMKAAVEPPKPESPDSGK
jgi:TonB family protein